MVDVYDSMGGNVMAVMEVPHDQVSNYGVLDVAHDYGDLMSIKGMVEKPPVDQAPSNLAVVGRYILTPRILENLNGQTEGSGGEVQLTDAIAREIGQSADVYGYRFKGERFDCGSKAGFLRANLAFALSRPELRNDLLTFMSEQLGGQIAAQ